MMIICFLFILLAQSKGFDISDMAFLIISVAYIGDCVLLGKVMGEKDET